MLEEDNIWLASFDIGKVNFCFYVESINVKELSHIKNIPKNERYLPNGKCTPEFSDIIKKIYTNGNKILLKNVNLTKGTTTNKYFDIDLCHNLNDILNEHTEYWDKVDYFVVEQQMSFGKKTNTIALKLAQHCESYFICKYGRNKNVIEFPSYHKTQILGSEKIERVTKTGKISYKNVDQRARKKWAVEECIYILSEREDFDTLSEISSAKKKDDFSDTVTQLQAFKYLKFVDNAKF